MSNNKDEQLNEILGPALKAAAAALSKGMSTPLGQWAVRNLQNAGKYPADAIAQAGIGAASALGLQKIWDRMTDDERNELLNDPAEDAMEHGVGLKDDIENVMKESSTTLINTRLRNIADMTGMTDDEVRQKMKDMPFEKYVDLMRALRDVDAEAAKTILGEYNMGSQGTRGTLNTQQNRQMKQGQAVQSSAPQQQQQSIAAKTKALGRMGRDKLGGVTPNQAAQAMDKAEQGKPLTKPQRQAMAAMTQNFDAVATNPKTAPQMRALMNKLPKQ